MPDFFFFEPIFTTSIDIGRYDASVVGPNLASHDELLIGLVRKMKGTFVYIIQCQANGNFIVFVDRRVFIQIRRAHLYHFMIRMRFFECFEQLR